MKNKSMINMLICSVVIFSSTITSTFAACPDAKDVASAIKYKPFLNPGMSMTPTNGGEEFIIGEVARGSGTRTGTDAPKTLSVIDQAEQCHYREGKTMTGITFSIDLVPLKNFANYWHNHQLSGIYVGNYNKAQEVLQQSIKRSKELSIQLSKMNPPL